MARPPKPLDDASVYAMAERGWSDESIAAVYHVDPRTVRARYGADLEEARLAGKQKIMDLMYELAFKDRDASAAKYLCDRKFGPIERKITFTLEDARRALESDLRARGIEVDSAIESITSGESEADD
jgi:hypothetical protein